MAHHYSVKQDVSRSLHYTNFLWGRGRGNRAKPKHTVEWVAEETGGKEPALNLLCVCEAKGSVTLHWHGLLDVKNDYYVYACKHSTLSVFTNVISSRHNMAGVTLQSSVIYRNVCTCIILLRV